MLIYSAALCVGQTTNVSCITNGAHQNIILCSLEEEIFLYLFVSSLCVWSLLCDSFPSMRQSEEGDVCSGSEEAWKINQWHHDSQNQIFVLFIWRNYCLFDLLCRKYRWQHSTDKWLPIGKDFRPFFHYLIDSFPHIFIWCWGYFWHLALWKIPVEGETY